MEPRCYQVGDEFFRVHLDTRPYGASGNIVTARLFRVRPTGKIEEVEKDGKPVKFIAGDEYLVLQLLESHFLGKATEVPCAKMPG